MKISVVLPCYNEEGNIKLLYSELRSVLTDKYEYEIILLMMGVWMALSQQLKKLQWMIER